MFERMGAGGAYRWRDRRLEDGPSSADTVLGARYCRKIWRIAYYPTLQFLRDRLQLFEKYGVGVLDINCTQLVCVEPRIVDHRNTKEHNEL